MRFLFDPASVEDVLLSRPDLASRLPSPRTEGRCSASFADLRVTDRAIYRLLANPHYGHLRETMDAIDAVARAGLTLKELRAERTPSTFRSFLAEVMATDHLLSRGFVVGKSASGPDIEAEMGSLAVSIEVYSPRTWQAQDDWIEDVTDALKNADVPFEFAATIEITTSMTDADALEGAILVSGHGVLRQLTSALERLSDAEPLPTWRFDHAKSDMSTTVTFAHLAPNASALVREIFQSEPSRVEIPDIVFDGLIRKVEEKATKRQARRGASGHGGMIVDLQHTGLDAGLVARGAFDTKLNRLDLHHLDLDFIAFCLPERNADGPARGLSAPRVVYESDRITRAALEEMFDLAKAAGADLGDDRPSGKRR